MTNCRAGASAGFPQQPERLPYNNIAFIIQYENRFAVCGIIIVAIGAFSVRAADAAIHH